MILIISVGGLRLCNDGRWRSFANYGCTPGCVKEYRLLSAAHKKAKRVKGRVVVIPKGKGYEINAVGEITNDETNSKHTLEEFIVPNLEPPASDPFLSVVGEMLDAVAR
jgi:hypothetical protein